MVNKVELRHFITQYFSELELDELCFDYYPDVLDQFTTGMTKSQKVIALIGYCERRGLWNHLLITLTELRPVAYQNQFGQVPKRQASDRTVGRDPNRIFLSHANQDAAFARQLADDLRHNGFDIWMAPESIEPGEKWIDAIERGLETSGIFVLVITPQAVNSKWVRDESNYAIASQNKDEMRLFTLQVGEGRMPPMWSVRQHISFREDYGAGLRQLLAALSPDRFTVQPASPPAETAVPQVEGSEAKPTAKPQVELTSDPLVLNQTPVDPIVAPWKKSVPWWLILIEGIVWVGVGMYMFNAEPLVDIILGCVALLLVVNGMFSLYLAMRATKQTPLRQFTFYHGITGVATGGIAIIMYIKQETLTQSSGLLGLFIGFFGLLVYGGMGLNALVNKHFVSLRGVSLISSIAVALIGILGMMVLIGVIEASSTLYIICCISIMIVGFGLLFWALKLRRSAKA